MGRVDRDRHRPAQVVLLQSQRLFLRGREARLLQGSEHEGDHAAELLGAVDGYTRSEPPPQHDSIRGWIERCPGDSDVWASLRIWRHLPDNGVGDHPGRLDTLSAALVPVVRAAVCFDWTVQGIQGARQTRYAGVPGLRTG